MKKRSLNVFPIFGIVIKLFDFLPQQNQQLISKLVQGGTLQGKEVEEYVQGRLLTPMLTLKLEHVRKSPDIGVQLGGCNL